MRRTYSGWRTTLVLAALALFAPLAARAQATATVTGTVSDSTSGRPISMVQVVLVGTTRGGVTDEAGRYTIRGVDAGTFQVRAQRIGYRPTTRTVTVGDGETAEANFLVAEVARVLSEVVSIGYGTDTRASVTNSVTTVEPEQVQGTPLAGVDAALQGRAAGVQVTQNAGNPGVGITVRIRGSASLTASNQPLWVVDGVPIIREDYSQLDVGGQDVTGVSGLNPDEIESITVLKDAAAAAIYGSRASNGVVMITTKRGRAGVSRINIDAYTGTQDVPKNSRWDLLDAKEYLTYRNEARSNDGFGLNYYGNPDTVTRSTDWQDLVMRRAPVANATLGLDGGSEKIQYYLSGSIFDQTGVILASGYRRAAGRMNLDFNASNKLRVSSSLGVSRESHQRIENDNTIEGIGANAIALAPNAPVRRPDGTYTAFDYLEYINPMAIAQYNSIETRTIRTFGNIEANYNFTPDFTLTGRLGADLMNLRDLRWDSPSVEDSYAFTANGVSTQAQTNANRYLTELWGTYNLRAFENQTASITLGSSLEWNGSENDYIRGEGFASEGFRYPGAATKVTSYDGGWTGNNLASFFGRANYSFLDRYQLMASLRADGSSRFGENNRWGIFPAASFGWTVSEEPVIQSMLGGTGLKLRFSYGTTGNQALTEDFAPLERYARANYAEEIGLAQVSIANPDLRWETTRELDGGFDLALFNSRISLIGDYYQKYTTDLLVDKPISATTGQTSRLENVGSMKNAGVEFELSTRNFVSDRTGGFEWTTDFNVAHNKNRIVSLYRDQPFSSGRYDINRVQVGHPIGEFYAYKFAGVDPANGNALYYKANGSKTTYTGLTADDQMFVGSPHAKYTGGFTNTLSWAGLDLRAFLQFSEGNKIFNAIRVFADDGGRYADNKFGDVLRRWRKAGDITDQPRASRRGRSGALVISDRIIEDGSYVRLGEVTLGYNLPARYAGIANLQNARLYVSGRNLYTWTDFTGYSPDVNTNGSSANISLGTEFYTYPPARTFTLGLKANW